MWKTLDDTNMSWIDKKIVSIQWQLSSIKRHIKRAGVKEGIKKWWHLRQVCKKVNKSLLKKVKEMENKALNKD